MPAQVFNDRSLAATTVPQTGTFGNAHEAPAPAKAGNQQKGVQTFDPAGSPRVTVEKMWTDGKSTPSGSKNKWPKGVNSFTDSAV